MTFGEKLQCLRKTRGLSQEQLAAQVTVSRQAVSKWELDAAMPDIENILQISRLFGVTTDFLLDNALAGIEGGTMDPSEVPAVEASKIQGMKQKKPVIQIFLIVLAIYMIAFAISIMIQPLFLPFFAMLATAVSIVVVILMPKKWR